MEILSRRLVWKDPSCLPQRVPTALRTMRLSYNVEGTCCCVQQMVRLVQVSKVNWWNMNVGGLSAWTPNCPFREKFYTDKLRWRGWDDFCAYTCDGFGLIKGGGGGQFSCFGPFSRSKLGPPS